MRIEDLSQEVKDKVKQLLDNAPADQKAEAIMQSIEMIDEAMHADLIQQGGIVAPVELRVTHRNARFLCLTVELRFHSQTDFIQRGMIQLLDNSDLFGTVVFGGCPATGQQGQGHEYGKRSAKQFFHNNFSLIQMIWLDGFGFPTPSSAWLSHTATSFRKES